MMKKNTEAIKKSIYPLVDSNIRKRVSNYKKYMGEFISARSEDLYDIAPCRRIYFTIKDEVELCKAINVDSKMVDGYLKNTYYASISAFNPAAAKDPVTIILLCLVRYFYLAKDDKNLDLAIINLAFSGKFYPSIHYGSFSKVQPAEYRWVMEYVVNNMITNKFDLKIHGNVIGAIKSISKTWLETYKDRFKDFDDEDCVYLIQQLHGRIKSFMKNIATLYYKAYENKSQYISYSSDNYSNDDFRIAETDSLIAEKIIDKAVVNISTNSVNFKYCKMASDSLVRTDEIKDIIEYIIKNDTKEMTTIREYLSLIVYSYFEQSQNKDVRTVDFIQYSIRPKPNSKDNKTIRLKEITEDWLMKSSKRYIHRRKREATRQSYMRAVLMYFTLVIHFNSL